MCSPRDVSNCHQVSAHLKVQTFRRPDQPRQRNGGSSNVAPKIDMMRTKDGFQLPYIWFSDIYFMVDTVLPYWGV